MDRSFRRAVLNQKRKSIDVLDERTAWLHLEVDDLSIR